MGVYPGVEVFDEPDEVDVLDARDVGKRLGRVYGYCHLKRLEGQSCHEQIKNPYYCHRFPPEVIGNPVWLYYRFTLSFRQFAFVNVTMPPK